MTPAVLARLEYFQGLSSREMHILHRKFRFSDKMYNLVTPLGSSWKILRIQETCDCGWTELASLG